jgi:hypothetical protein
MSGFLGFFYKQMVGSANVAEILEYILNVLVSHDRKEWLFIVMSL